MTAASKAMLVLVWLSSLGRYERRCRFALIDILAVDAHSIPMFMQAPFHLKLPREGCEVAG